MSFGWRRYSSIETRNYRKFIASTFSDDLISQSAMSVPICRFEDFKEIKLRHASLYYIENFLSKAEADQLFEFCDQDLYDQFEDHAVVVRNEVFQQPRKTCLFGTKKYSYSGLILTPIPIPDEMEYMVDRLEILLPGLPRFNTILGNRYDNGHHYISPHSDSEKDLSIDIIASVSIGATRHFDIRAKNKEETKIRIDLTHGSLVVMGPKMQQYYTHEIPKQRTVTETRYNFTFRVHN